MAASILSLDVGCCHAGLSAQRRLPVDGRAELDFYDASVLDRCRRSCCCRVVGFFAVIVWSWGLCSGAVGLTIMAGVESLVIPPCCGKGHCFIYALSPAPAKLGNFSSFVREGKDTVGRDSHTNPL